MYVTQTPQRTDNTRAAQGAYCNQLATRYTRLPPASRAGSNREQHHTRAVVCPRCITAAVASYLIFGVVAFHTGPCDL